MTSRFTTWNEVVGLPLARRHHHDTTQQGQVTPAPHDVLVTLDTQQPDSAFVTLRFAAPELWHILSPGYVWEVRDTIDYFDCGSSCGNGRPVWESGGRKVVVSDDAGGAGRVADPFADLDAYVGLPRVGGLWLSPDGHRLVVGVARLDYTKTRYVTALWEVDPQGARPARRLTRSAQGESGAAFTPGGDLLFVSRRSKPDGADEKARASLWLQPACGGDARVVAWPPGGVRGVVVARDAGTVALGSALMPSSTDTDSDQDLRAKREQAEVSAILHEEHPVRFWDHDLGPDRTRLLVADLAEDFASGDAQLDLRDITGHVGRALGDKSSWDITPNGRTLVTAWAVAEAAGSERYTVVAIDVVSGERRVLAGDPDHDYDSPRLSPDGMQVALRVHHRPTPQDPGDSWLGVVPVTGGGVRALTAAWDRWPHSPRWTPDGAALVVIADEQGCTPLWHVDAATGEPTRLTREGAYTDVEVSPDGRWAYALRSSVGCPPAPVRINLDATSPVETLPGPGEALGLTVQVPGRLEQVTTIAADTTPLRAWIAVPPGAGADAPAPLLLWIHGGPLSSWTTWHWDWNPWLAVAQGYTVLLPDPALSTGYGINFLRRGWGAWGDTPYTDLMSITDAAETRLDVDAERTAAMGASFGGYMANWVAGHTDRFAAIVTHASPWALDQLGPTTDEPFHWQRMMTPEMAEANSPHRFANAIVTPMLVVHGDKDYRVPIGESLRLWWDLTSRSKTQNGSSPHKFLYFPQENHGNLAPNHLKIWYSTVFAFLAQHLRGQDWQRPNLLE